MSPQPRARQPRRSQTIVEGTKDREDQNEDWQDDKGQVLCYRNQSTIGTIYFKNRETVVYIKYILEILLNVNCLITNTFFFVEAYIG